MLWCYLIRIFFRKWKKIECHKLKMKWCQPFYSCSHTFPPFFFCTKFCQDGIRFSNKSILLEACRGYTLSTLRWNKFRKSKEEGKDHNLFTTTPHSRSKNANRIIVHYGLSKMLCMLKRHTHTHTHYYFSVLASIQIFNAHISEQIRCNKSCVVVCVYVCVYVYGCMYWVNERM